MKARTAWRYLGRPIVAAWLVVSILFLLTRAVSNNTSFIQATLEADSRLQLAEREQLTQQLLHRSGLDRPLFYVSFHPITGWQWQGIHNQYHAWASRLLHADLGLSYRSQNPVSELLVEALRYTLPLTVLAALLSLGLGLGVATGLHLTSPPRRTAVLTALQALQAAPLFLIATGLLLLFANPDFLDWFPSFGLGTEEETTAWWQLPGRQLYYLALPVFSLVLVSTPPLIIQLDGALQQELQQLYVVTARAKGASQRQVIWRHALRNAFLPTLTLLSELLPNLVAGAVVVEVLFALPGMGRLLAEAAATQDHPVLLGGVVLIVVTRVVAQLLADGAYRLADPRIRL
ncbi:ABC transporter permease [Hymenobacter sediminis]|uniref:ABC transporter permease n=1 Tax=Hymenobacter sediminis TaxID=2218621 RepID=UPI000DA68FB8|nr:ABC transporter permease [Hymenobacter sediminis]RPD50115.1 ABC transporter permease [Hymenobacter sediminis]